MYCSGGREKVNLEKTVGCKNKIFFYPKNKKKLNILIVKMLNIK